MPDPVQHSEERVCIYCDGDGCGECDNTGKRYRTTLQVDGIGATVSGSAPLTPETQDALAEVMRAAYRKMTDDDSAPRQSGVEAEGAAQQDGERDPWFRSREDQYFIVGISGGEIRGPQVGKAISQHFSAISPGISVQGPFERPPQTPEGEVVWMRPAFDMRGSLASLTVCDPQHKQAVPYRVEMYPDSQAREITEGDR